MFCSIINDYSCLSVSGGQQKQFDLIETQDAVGLVNQMLSKLTRFFDCHMIILAMYSHTIYRLSSREANEASLPAYNYLGDVCMQSLSNSLVPNLKNISVR